MSLSSRKALFVFGILAVGVALIIYDQIIHLPGLLFAHSTVISIFGLVLCLIGLILLRTL